jgi:hypothetical protein
MPERTSAGVLSTLATAFGITRTGGGLCQARRQSKPRALSSASGKMKLSSRGTGDMQFPPDIAPFDYVSIYFAGDSPIGNGWQGVLVTEIGRKRVRIVEPTHATFATITVDDLSRAVPVSTTRRKLIRRLKEAARRREPTKELKSVITSLRAKSSGF